MGSWWTYYKRYRCLYDGSIHYLKDGIKGRKAICPGCKRLINNPMIIQNRKRRFKKVIIDELFHPTFWWCEVQREEVIEPVPEGHP